MPTPTVVAMGLKSPYDRLDHGSTVSDDLKSPCRDGLTVSVNDSTTAEHPKPVSRVNKILFLDGLRGLAAIMVVFHHMGLVGGLNLGSPAVGTFFVLSAFLLTMIFETKARGLFQRQANARSWAIALADYFVRRFLRIYPLFAVVACVIAVLSDDAQQWLFSSRKYYDHYNLFKTLTFYVDYRYHTFWTLPIEIGYYFIIPPLVIAFVRIGKFWWLLAVAAYSWVFYSGLYISRATHSEMGPHIPTFLCGSLGAIVYGKIDRAMAKKELKLRTWQRLLLSTIELVAIVYTLSVCFHAMLYDWIAAGPFPQPASNVPFVSFSMTVVIIAEMLNPGPIASVLEWSLLRYAGKISYSMYLLHIWITRSSVIHSLSSQTNRFFAMWTLILLVSTISFHLIEAPSQKLATSIGKYLKMVELRSNTSPVAKAGHPA